MKEYQTEINVKMERPTIVAAQVPNGLSLIPNGLLSC